MSRASEFEDAYRRGSKLWGEARGIDRRREAFEKWMIDEAKCVVGSSDPYPAALESDYWRVWQAAWERAAL